MSLSVLNNIAALDAYNHLTITNNQMQSSLEKLSSGKRINHAADDAAGLVISEKLQSTIGGLNAATQNAQDGISVVQTADGALEEVQNMLQRMRDLAVQAANTGANGGTSGTAVAASQAEVDQLVSEIDNISSSTKFNGQALLNSTGSLTFQVGADSGDTMTVTLSNMSASGLSLTSLSLGNASVLSTIDSAIDSVSTFRGSLGAYQNRLQHTINNLSVTAENVTAAESRIADTDMASEMTKYSSSQILQQAGTAMLAQANQSSQGILKLLQG